jgi:hypothetical protein
MAAVAVVTFTMGPGMGMHYSAGDTLTQTQAAHQAAS